MNVGLYGKGLMLYSWDHKPRITIPRFPDDLGVFEKHGNETKEAVHEDRERSQGRGASTCADILLWITVQRGQPENDQ